MDRQNPQLTRSERKWANHESGLATRTEAESILRDIAFVLQMTQRIHAEMESAEETEAEAMLV